MSAQQWAPPWTPQQQYRFIGTLNDPDERHKTLEFYVLAGPGAPTVTGGWPKISTIDRPRRKGFSMPTGYDPASMDVPIRFEATVDYGQYGLTPDQLETNIQILEWMAGRGRLYTNGTTPAHGNPPIVQVASFLAGDTGQSGLIPPNWQPPWINGWLISQLQYDQSPIRGREGKRRRQDAVVSLTEYVAVPGAPSSPSQRQKGRGTAGGYQTFTTTRATDTIAKLCIAHGINKPSKWRAVVAYNQPGPRSYLQHLKPGTKIRIPNSLFSKTDS